MEPKKEGVLSWKAIKSFDPKWWDKTVLKSAEKSLFQLDRKYDSSSRTLAADILIESQPSDKLLENLLQLVISEEPAYEIKQYTLQRIKMLSDEDPLFKERVLGIIKKNKQLNNYSGLSPRGLSTALKREFLRSPSSNGSLVSIQEIKNGIAKRGTVNVVMQKDGVVREIFSLGIFSGGLSNLLSSDGDADEEEYMTAGMELTVLGTQIRPFVFFEGQGELMGHVWSGTASEKTPALQVQDLLLKRISKEVLPLIYQEKIEISLWNRNAESVVEKSAGIAIMGTTKVDSYFVKTEIEFGASIEPKLNLQTDIDFSSNVHLCMRLTQPETVFRHNVFKIERIPGSKHKLRISKYKKSTIPGKTYSLNKKNNDMCGAIFG
ncbi:hypothetical protein NQ317_012733 [Molorchus minor]|uniref:MTP large subunit lipid-binding domain-containing protein n=1 Tax=Molorchus minor TaxID=1323400 RepID=A0ABQ9JM09_9CUCU|nr:hypothetical protein NQ317_012733 [Molorchus minor]